MARWFLLIVMVLMTACAHRNVNVWIELDQKFNQWLGQSKDDRIRQAGPPVSCTTLKTGEEVCEWIVQGQRGSAMNCVPNYATGGSLCHGGGGGSYEHHLIYTYNQNGIATFWSYRGSLGSRTSYDSAVTKPSTQDLSPLQSKPQD
jgi:hypothetical protein